MFNLNHKYYKSNDLNFFSKGIDEKDKTFKKKKQELVIRLIILYIIIILVLALGIQRSITKSQQVSTSYNSFLSTEDTMGKYAKYKDINDELTKNKEELRAVEALLEEYDKVPHISSSLILSVIEAIPNGLNYTNIYITPKQLKIEGTASAPKNVSKFLTNIQSLDYFKNVYIANISEVDSEGKGFTFVLISELEDINDNEVN